MQNMWIDFSDVELTQLCHGYGIEEECVFSQIMPAQLSNRLQIEQHLTRIELDNARAEVTH
jgi:hypothetical protein